MEQSTILHNVTAEQITSLFEKLENQLTEIRNNFEPKAPAEYLTRAEVALLLKCNLSTVHNWTKEGKLIPYGMGNRVYYKRSEIDAGLIPFGKNPIVK